MVRHVYCLYEIFYIWSLYVCYCLRALFGVLLNLTCVMHLRVFSIPTGTCECPQGTAVSEDVCSPQNPTKCASCGTGYTLKSDNTACEGIGLVASL